VGLASIDPAKAKAAVLLSPSGLVTATIPTNALNAPVTVELWDVPPTAEPMAQWHSTGLAFWLMADQQSPTTALLEPVSVRMAYRSKDLVHLDPSRLTLYRWDGSSKTWISLPTTVDANQHQVIVQTAEFGRFDLHAPLLCPSDSIEPDDDHGAALPITTDGIAVSRVFDIKNDVDWFRLEAEAGKIYIVRTGHLGEGVITALQVYDPDSQAPLASGKAANGGGSYLQWRAPFDGSYLIQVRPASGSTYGCQASYEFSVEEVLSPDRVTVTGPAEGRLETSYTFTATISPTAAAQPVTYVWQVDDQAPATHTAGLSDTLTLAWNTAGPHSISVTASNVAGKASSAHSFAVYTRAMAEFTASPLSGTAPLKVSFANTSSGDYTSSTWDLGDGSTSRSKNPTHTYEAPGVYTVTLTVSGPGGTDVKTRAEYISIQPATIPRGIGYHIYLPSIARNR
jgi:plastocyanin